MKVGVKSFLVFGIIKKIITGLFKFIYLFIKLLNLQLALLVGIVGLILYITGVLTPQSALSTIFYILLIFSLFYAIIKTVQFILFPSSRKKAKEKRSVQVVDKTATEVEEDKNNNPPINKETNNPPITKETVKETVVENQTKTQSGPVYYAVKQNPNYVMAEFSDRYELYQKTASGLVKVRTDYKN